MSTMNVTKVTLTSGKVVLLRDIKIKHTELAAQEAAPKANGDANVLSMLMQKILVRMLIVKINDKQPSATELEDMDELFTMAEYGQILQVVKKLTGGDEAGKLPAIEVVSSGSK
jgi:hypothetical protein